MLKPIFRSVVASLMLMNGAAWIAAQESATSRTKPVDLDLKGYKTVKDAAKADPKVFKETEDEVESIPAFIGVELSTTKKSTIVFSAILPDSPASSAGIQVNDELKKLAGQAVTLEQAKDQIRSAKVDEELAIEIQRGDKTLTLKVKPRALSKPMTSSTTSTSRPGRGIMGVQSGDPQKKGGVELTSVTNGGGADKAGIKAGDIIMKIDDKELTEDFDLRSALTDKKAGQVIKVVFLRDKKEQEVRVTLGDSSSPTRGTSSRTAWDDRLPRAWREKSYKLAVIGIEYPDQKHNDKVKDSDWEDSLFSVGKYSDRSATGQKVHGSMNDYYKEISYGDFKIDGKFVGWFEVSKKRTEYSSGSGTSSREKTALLSEAMDKVLSDKGKDALKDYDGVFFVYAGSRVQTTRGGLYWPHRATLRHASKSWPYFIVQEGGSRMTDISVFCHEFGHMLGLPDLYARPEVPGMEGVGVWCAMSQQLPNGKPQHFSAWSKQQLGWLKPVMIDPRVKQKLILSPIEEDNTQCFKIPIKADGSEYLLLENRNKKGFDEQLPAEGLLIWRVLPQNSTQRVFLEEAHGVGGPSGPRSYAGAVPFPSPANDSFTPYTTPSSKSQTGGGLEVHITNIRRLPDGRICFHIGYDYQ